MLYNNYNIQVLKFTHFYMDFKLSAVPYFKGHKAHLESLYNNYDIQVLKFTPFYIDFKLSTVPDFMGHKVHLESLFFSTIVCLMVRQIRYRAHLKSVWKLMNSRAFEVKNRFSFHITRCSQCMFRNVSASKTLSLGKKEKSKVA